MGYGMVVVNFIFFVDIYVRLNSSKFTIEVINSDFFFSKLVMANGGIYLSWKPQHDQSGRPKLESIDTGTNLFESEWPEEQCTWEMHETHEILSGRSAH